jgi:spermidine synthase
VPHRQPQTRAIAQNDDLVIELDPKRPAGRLMRQSGMDASYVDLADRTHLEFDYMRWLRIVLGAAGAKRVLHIGGGACALAQALAAEDPDGRQQVCEVDADVLAMAREHLGLRRAPGLRVRHAEGRAHIAAQPDSSWDAVVIDAFVGARIPRRLITAEALADAARVAAMTLINVVDDRAESLVSTVASAMALAYPEVWTLGQPGGNTVVAGSTRDRSPDLERVATQAAADPSPARLTTPSELAQAIAATPPLRDRPSP